MPQPSAKVIRAIVKQFEKAGTAALEAKEIWKTIGIPNAIRDLKHSPSFTLEQGLRLTLDWYRKDLATVSAAG